MLVAVLACLLAGIVVSNSGFVSERASLGPDDAQWVDYAPMKDLPGHGRLVVLISGDEEYRSEEAMPQLGKILSQRHGFACRVVFAIEPSTGEINPDNRSNIPGLEALDQADLMIIATRFRDLPDEQMVFIDRYIRSGKPIIGMRTATHAFDIKSSPTYKRYTWNGDIAGYEQGFGRQILGETWVAHHGHHGVESTRGIIAPDARALPITRGISDGDVWGPTDVYRVRLPLPGDAQPIVLGQVLAGMHPDDEPVTDEKNNPLMPVAWMKTYRGDDGTVGRVFTTTMGSSTDLERAGTRRLLVNGVYWAVGLEDAIPAEGTNVDLVGDFRPTPFGFGKFTKGVKPSSHAWTGRAHELSVPSDPE